MKLQPMKYGDYVWPHNPETLRVTCKRSVQELKSPFWGSVMQDYGLQKRVIEGEGAFYGEDCIQQFQELSGVLGQQTSAVLTLPNIPPFTARFLLLELIGASEPDLVRYRFEFWEESAAVPTAAAREGEVYYCKEGDDVWRIAAAFSSTPEKILAKNPFLRWPNYLKEGEQVILP